MKLNERLYEELGYAPFNPEVDDAETYEAKPSTPFETQELEGHKVELYYMDDFPQVLDEFTNKGKFAVWSSKDGVDYRLAVEKKYYETLSDLYSKKVNQVWLNFWDECDRIQKNFSFKLVLPLTCVVVVVFLLLVNLKNWFNVNVPDSVTIGLTFGIPLVYIIFIMFLRSRVMKKINLAQADSIQKIKNDLGAAKFENLLRGQRTYIDEFFKAREEAIEKEYEESLEEELTEEKDNNEEDNKEEVKEETEEENEVEDKEVEEKETKE